MKIDHSYITDLKAVDIDLEVTPIVVKAHGHDCLSLLYNILNEFLCSNNTLDMLIRDVRLVTELDGQDFSSARLLGFRTLMSIHSCRFGECYDPPEAGPKELRSKLSPTVICKFTYVRTLHIFM